MKSEMVGERNGIMEVGQEGDVERERACDVKEFLTDLKLVISPWKTASERISRIHRIFSVKMLAWAKAESDPRGPK